MVMDLHGSITGDDGRSGSISGPADRAVLSAVRRFSDAVLIGAQTMRTEIYSPLRMSADRQALRRDRGLAAAPRLVIVSASLELPWDAPVFHESTQPPLIVAPHSSPADRRAGLPDSVELLLAPGERVEPRWLVDALADRGLAHVACEGGARLLSEMAKANCIDEWDLTVSGVTGAQRYRPVAARSEDEFVFTRFLREDI